MAQGLTEQQTKELIQELENLGAESSMIDEILHVLDSVSPADGSTPPLEGGGVSRSAVRMKMMEEEDWRKRAALAALLISSEL